MKVDYKNIIFLDMDGVLNCELFYLEQHAHLTRHDNIPFYRTVKKHLKKLFHKKEISDLDYYKRQICARRMGMLNDLCKETNSAVVISASMRCGKTIERLREIFNYCGATFRIIGKTERLGYERGIEISQWLRENITPETHGCHYFDFYRYAVIDDDSDMLLDQANHFFQTDSYAGLTPNICYRIKRFFLHEAF